MKRLMTYAFAILLVLCLAACSAPSSVPASADISASTEVPEEKNDDRSIVLSISDEVVFIGDTAQANAVVKNDDVSTVLKWASSNEKVAVVDDKGNITAVSAGKASITAYAKDNDSIASSAEFEVALHVSSLSISEAEVLLLTGSDMADKQLSCNVIPAEAYYQEVVWESSDNSVVTVDEKGVIHAVSPGEAIINASSLDSACSEKSQCNVTVKQGVSSITLNMENEVIYENDKIKLTAEVQPEDAENKGIAWSSSDERVAMVSQDGTVSYVGVGQAIISCTATDGSTVTSECIIQAVKGVSSIALSQNTATLLLGASDKLATVTLVKTITPEDATYQDVTWISSDESVAKVDENGVVSGVSAGKAVITAYSTDKRVAEKAKASCSVTVGNAVTSIKLSGIEGDIAKGKSLRITAVLSPESIFNSKLEWKSSNEDVLKVDSNGTIKAVGVGSATITCSATDGSNVRCDETYTVIQAVTSLKGVESNVVLFDGQGLTLHINISPTDATNQELEWSSDSTCVSVSQDGSITAQNAGEATITATSIDGSNKSCKFKVYVEDGAPLDLESIGFGVYNSSLLGLTVRNKCKRTTIVDFDFDMTLLSYDKSVIDSGSYSLGSPVKLAAGAKKTIKRTVYGVGMAKYVVITITAVKLSDGTIYTIPITQQDECVFSR